MEPSCVVGALATAVFAVTGVAPAAAAAEPGDLLHGATAIEARDYIPGGTYLIASNLTIECMTLTYTDISAEPCIDYRAVWVIQPINDGTDEVYIRQGNLCVSDIVDYATGNDLSALPCTGTVDERWRMVATAGVGFKIVAEPGRVMVVEPPLDCDVTDHVRVRQEQGSPAEFWGLYPL